MDLKEKIKKLPSCPGVYLMKDSLDSVIYVGKSNNLKSRVGSYFYNSKSHSPKVIKLVKNLKDFDYITTDTEFEAFMLECSLIKVIKPMYNKLMKTPSAYCYVTVTIKEKYPEIKISQDVIKEDGNLYFGPYTNKNTVERAILGIKECCTILCNNSSLRSSSCLNYSLGLCMGMCLNNEAERDEYLSQINKIVNLFNSTDKAIIEMMEAKMNLASENFDFESAAKYRDYLSAVNYMVDRNNVVDYMQTNRNIVIVENLNANTIKLFIIKGNKILFSERYALVNTTSEELKSIFKTNIISHYKDEMLNASGTIERDEIDELHIIYAYLKNKSNSCRHAVILDEWVRDENSIDIEIALNSLLASLN